MSCCTPWWYQRSQAKLDIASPLSVFRVEPSGHDLTGADLFAEPEEPRVEYGRLVVQLTQVLP